ncbi:MAG: hypothetical protein WCY12_02585 [Candidatus Omnitrophota bacterium]
MLKNEYLNMKFGQSTAEFAVLLAVVAAALISMQVYLKRGIQGRVKDLASQIAPDASGKGAQQYDPGRTVSEYTTIQAANTAQEYVNGVTTTYQNGDYGSSAETMTRSGYEKTLPETQ